MTADGRRGDPVERRPAARPAGRGTPTTDQEARGAAGARRAVGRTDWLTARAPLDWTVTMEDLNDPTLFGKTRLGGSQAGVLPAARLVEGKAQLALLRRLSTRAEQSSGLLKRCGMTLVVASFATAIYTLLLIAGASAALSQQFASLSLAALIGITGAATMVLHQRAQAKADLYRLEADRLEGLLDLLPPVVAAVGAGRVGSG